MMVGWLFGHNISQGNPKDDDSTNWRKSIEFLPSQICLFTIKIKLTKRRLLWMSEVCHCVLRK